MKKILNKIDKYFLNSKFLILIIFLIGTLITLPSLIPTYSLDGYCQLSYGYRDYLLLFIKAGRFITALFYKLFDLINLNHDILSILSIIFSNIFLSIAVYSVFTKIKPFINQNLFSKIILLIGAFLIIYNPFTLEYFIFEESFAMCLALLLSIEAANIIYNNSNYKYIKTFILLISANMLYQGAINIFPPYLILLIIFVNKNSSIKKILTNNLKIIFISAIIYLSSFIFAFIALKTALLVFKLEETKVSSFAILSNIKNIYHLLNQTFKNLFGMFNISIFKNYIYIFSTILFAKIIFDIKNKSKYLLYILIIITLVIFTPFIPNIIVRYTEPRMLISLGGLIGFIIIISLILVDKNDSINKFYLILILLFSTSFLLINNYNYLKISYFGLTRYNKDVTKINSIQDKISYYEDQENIKIQNIYYIASPTRLYYYDGLNNGYNIRVTAVDWGFTCAINGINNKNYNTYELNISSSNYDELINNNGLLFKDENLYILLD